MICVYISKCHHTLILYKLLLTTTKTMTDKNLKLRFDNFNLITVYLLTGGHKIKL